MGATTARQQSLFDDAAGGPPGLQYEQDFIDADEERHLLADIGGLELREAEYRGHRAKARVKAVDASRPRIFREG